jgi:predicted RNA-binding protein with PIN domain
MKKNAFILIAGIVLVLGMWWLKSSRDAAYVRFVESLYQQCQADTRAEFARRQANADRLEAVEAQTAAAYQAKIDGIAAATDERIAALNIRSNGALRKAKASSEEILQEKAKVETALGEMTLGRDVLVIAAHNREKAIFLERQALAAEISAAVAAKVKELDICEKARQEAMSRTIRRTWISIGPGGSIYMADGQVRAATSISIHIPVIEIKSPFKRF